MPRRNTCKRLSMMQTEMAVNAEPVVAGGQPDYHRGSHHMVAPEKDVLVASTGQHQHCHLVLRDQWLERLIDRLPGYLQSAVRWSRRPSSRWVRVPAGVFLIGASILGFLPVLGFWMLPLGLVLLAASALGNRSPP